MKRNKMLLVTMITVIAMTVFLIICNTDYPRRYIIQRRR